MKHGGGLIIAVGKEGGHGEGLGDDKEGSEGEDAMKDFLQAVEDKDPKAMYLAFCRAYEHEASEPPAEEEKEA